MSQFVVDTWIYKLIKKLNLNIFDELFINACDVSFAFDKRSFQNKKYNEYGYIHYILLQNLWLIITKELIIMDGFIFK